MTIIMIIMMMMMMLMMVGYRLQASGITWKNQMKKAKKARPKGWHRSDKWVGWSEYTFHVVVSQFIYYYYYHRFFCKVLSFFFFVAAVYPPVPPSPPLPLTVIYTTMYPNFQCIYVVHISQGKTPKLCNQGRLEDRPQGAEFEPSVIAVKKFWVNCWAHNAMDRGPILLSFFFCLRSLVFLFLCPFISNFLQYFIAKAPLPAGAHGQSRLLNILFVIVW